MAQATRSRNIAELCFGTFELLEQILLSLPLKDVLLMQRIGKIWRDVVMKSHKLRRSLFFKPFDTFATEEEVPSMGIFLSHRM